MSETGELQEAAPLIESSMSTREAGSSFRDLRVGEARLYLARHLLRSGREAEARALLEETLAQVKILKPEGHWLRRTADRVATAFQ